MTDSKSPSSGFTRRGFLKTASATAGVLGLAGVAGMTATNNWLAPTKAHAEDAASDEIVRYTFHQDHCGGMCSLKCTVRDGRMVHIEPNKRADGVFDSICLKGISEIQHVYSNHRVQTPLKRVGERGANEFAAISWDEALDEIADKLMEIQETYGKQAVMMGNAGESGTAGQFLSKIIGAQGKGKTGVDSGVGNGLDPAYGFGGGYAKATGEPRDWVNSRFLLTVGSNWCESSLPQVRLFFEAKEAGCKTVTVDPHFSTTAGKSDMWVPIEPGTDAALFLGMISSILENGQYDSEFMRTCTSFPFLVSQETKETIREHALDPEIEEPETGEENPYYVIDDATGNVVPYEETESPRLSGSAEVNGVRVCTVFDLLVASQKDYPVEWAAEVTGIAPDTIELLASEYSVGPSCLALGWGGNDKMTNADIAGHAAAILAGLTGNIGKVGAHVGIFTSGDYIGKIVKLGSWELPSEMKESKNEEPFYDVRTKPTSVKALVSNGDLLVQSLANMSKTVDWINTLELLVSIDPYFTEACKWADYVLPATTRFELIDDYGNIRPGYNQIVMQQKVLDPLFEAKPDLWIQREIASRMGYDNVLPESTVEYCESILAGAKDDYVKRLTLDQLAENCCIWPIEDVATPRREFMDGKFETPSGRMELYYDSMIEFDQQLPRWEPCSEIYADNPAREKFPLQLANNRSRFTIHNQFYDAEWIQDIFQPIVELNPIDMERYEIESGDIAEVYNDRGNFKVRAVANNSVRPGCVRAYDGTTSDYIVEGNMQSVTNDTMIERGYKLMNGPVAPYCDTLVAIRKA